MSKRYRHRVGVRAEICFELELDAAEPTPEQLRDCVVAVLNRTADEERGFPLPALAGKVFPEWSSIDADIHPEDVLNLGAVRSFGVVKAIPASSSSKNR